ncbi:MAG: hypothetical protein M0R80_00895 [Proteobacteria bacterium]|jgi:hypothetical protein|nr:hypothetical protein [Pseudomonadota bacterium]
MNPNKQQWIEETQRFQCIAGVEVSSAEELGDEWDEFSNSRKMRELEKIKTHNTIAEVARRMK